MKRPPSPPHSDAYTLRLFLQDSEQRGEVFNVIREYRIPNKTGSLSQPLHQLSISNDNQSPFCLGGGIATLGPGI